MTRVLLAAAAVLALAAGCGGSSHPKAVRSDDVAVVGSESISKAQFNAVLDQARRSFKAQKRSFPKAGSAQYKALQDQALSFLVQRAEFEQKAKDLGVTVTDKQVDARLAQPLREQDRLHAAQVLLDASSQNYVVEMT